MRLLLPLLLIPIGSCRVDRTGPVREVPVGNCTIVDRQITCPDGTSVEIPEQSPGEPGPRGEPGSSCSINESGLISCDDGSEYQVIDGQDGESIAGPVGPTGPAGADGVDGQDALQIIPSQTTIVVNRQLDWETNNYQDVNLLLVIVPEFLMVNALPNTSNPQGGWVDIRFDTEVYCYQRDSNSYRYSFKYKKLSGATLGCDSNSEKETSAFAMSVIDILKIHVIPRDPKQANVTWNITISSFKYE